MSFAFLDYLECKEVKQAFMRRQMAFILSFDCKDILWSNGAAAYFFGFSSVSDMVGKQSFFDRMVHRKILKAAQYASSVTLSGLKHHAEFSVISVDIVGLGKAFLLEASLKEDISLIAGLGNATMSVAVVDEHATVLEANPHCCVVDETIKILLQTIDNGTPVKTILPIAGFNTQVGIIRLKVKPASFLIFYASLKAGDLNKEQTPFRFMPELLPRRFTWKIDKNGKFYDISRELAEIVGPVSSCILGSNFYELANKFRDERYLTLGGFIEAATPWSKQTVQWPIDNCSEWLDVELSAVPVFDVKHQLKEFRGFGIFKMQQKVQKQGDEKSDTSISGLSEIERSAFLEIAERLRGELHSPVKPELLDEKTTGQLSSFQTFSVNVIEQTLVKEPAAVLSLLDTALDGVLWLDEQGCIQAVSSAALALTGYEINELLKQPLSSLFALQSQPLVKKYFKLIRANKKKQVLNHGETAVLVTKNHKNTTVSMTIVPLAQQCNYAVILRNATEAVLSLNKKIEENKVIGIVHEMRTPLNALIGFAKIMNDGRFGSIDNERYRGYLRDIISSGKHILSLVNQLLESSKANHFSVDNQIITPLTVETTETFDVISCLRSSTSFLETQANDNGIIMRIFAPEHVPFICVPQQIFRQVIWNILSNAIRFTPPGGQIIIHVSYGKKGRVKISVSDNGIGMNDEEIMQAMQPYGQVKRKDGRSGDSAFVGTGLGLPMCKSMVEESGGEFLLFSRPNHGTTVEMFFPVFHE
ncbi:ATP-binding protein [Bartonella sp. B17]